MQRQSEWAQLEQLLKRVGYGEVFNLPVEHGKPRLDRPLRVLTSRFLDPHESVRSRPKDADGLRSARFQQLIRICEQRGSVVISRLTVQDGLPHRIEIEGELGPQ